MFLFELNDLDPLMKIKKSSIMFQKENRSQFQKLKTVIMTLIVLFFIPKWIFSFGDRIDF